MTKPLFDTGPSAPKITAIAPWFGGKRTLAPHIVRELGKHSVYWEPFCGSLAVLFEKPKSSSETVNDLNGDLINLVRVVASDQGPDLFERLSRTMFAEELVADAKAMRRTTAAIAPLDAAYWFFIESWMGRNGVAGTRASNTAFCVRYTSNGGDPAVRFRNAVASIPAWAERLMGVTVLSRDAFELLARIEDKAGTVIYCDPPYFTKGAKYAHDFDEPLLEFADGRITPIHWAYELEPGQPAPKRIDAHAYLAKLLSRFKKTRVVVSYYDDQRLADLYPNWTTVRLKATKAMVNQGMRDSTGTTAAPEVLVINGPSHSEQRKAA
jgi:DNA adenine methylase